jgi:hypothetical protein
MPEIDIPGAMEKAADYITEKPEHFGKGRFKVAKGCYCTLGAYALMLGADYGDANSPYLGAAGEAFDRGWEELSKTAREVSSFSFVQAMNDAAGTTADQMASVLRETAARLRAASDA